MTRKQTVNKQTASATEDQVESLHALLPQAFTEGKIDFEKLRASLGDFVDERPERYSFSWAGKRDAIRLLQTPSRATLIPAPKESIDFDTTQNLFIEGDNLEVLKLLYKPYFGQIKMIYIDPPYNTGNDFVYPDNFADPLDTYLQITGQKDSEGNLLTSNAETSGRYHSAWLSMMYPRLFLARQLLREDGVIFISIDDHEVHNLRLLMNEIFGEEQFMGSFIWKSRHNVDSRNKTGVSVDHEYVVAYGKAIRGKEIDTTKYSNPDDDPRGPWMSDNMVGLASAEKRPNLHYDLINPATGINYGRPPKGWRYEPASMNKLIAEGRIIWPSDATGRPRKKTYLKELKSQFTGLSSFLDVPNTLAGTQEIREIFGDDVFDFPKPLDLIKLLLEQATSENDIAFDFFAGSCPLAEAVLELNRQDGLNRRFIVSQLPEPTTKGSPSQKSGYATISEIGKERIRRVIKRMKKERAGQLPLDKPEDLGFKVFKLAISNYKQWYFDDVENVEAYIKQMQMFIDPLVEDYLDENVTYEVALKEGYGLNVRFERTTVRNVERVTDPDKDQSLYICLSDKIRLGDLRPLNLKKDDLFICRDIALNDETAANLALQCRLKTI